MQFAEVDVTEGWRAPSLLVAKVPGGLCLLLETVGKVAHIEGGGRLKRRNRKDTTYHLEDAGLACECPWEMQNEIPGRRHLRRGEDRLI
jgi:hypothetical protein